MLSSPVASNFAGLRNQVATVGHAGPIGGNAAAAVAAPQITPSAAPAAGGRAAIPTGRVAIRVPILMYHYVRVNADPGDKLGYALSVTPDDFNSQLDWLQANGYHTVDFDDLRAYYTGARALPARPVIITFDDGYRDLYTAAYPALLRRNMKAVAYLVSGFLGAPNNVTRDQVREMDLNGIEIGAHTFSHVDLTKVSDAELQRQLVDSRADLEQLVGHPVTDFCYPAGQFNAKVAQAVQRAGYDDATTTQDGVVHRLDDRYMWARVRVSGGESLAKFAEQLAATEPATILSSITSPSETRALPRLHLPLSYYRIAPVQPSPGAAGRALLP